jgi:hypothetical protein
VRRFSDDVNVERHGRFGETDVLVEDEIESLLVTQEPKWRKRTLGAWGFSTKVVTPNTRRFKGYFLSRLLERFPFLVECWYWALIYWVSYKPRNSSPLLTALGISIRSRRHSSLDHRRHHLRRSKTCTRSHRRGGEAPHILGTAHPTILHEEPARDDLDQSNILFHPHPRLDRFSRLAFLLHEYMEPNR